MAERGIRQIRSTLHHCKFAFILERPQILNSLGDRHQHRRLQRSRICTVGTESHIILFEADADIRALQQLADRLNKFRTMLYHLQACNLFRRLCHIPEVSQQIAVIAGDQHITGRTGESA
ncbi:hypothetical protein D3C86_1695030 [compost metagenome]